MSTYTYLDIGACIEQRPALPEMVLPGLLRGTVGAIVAPGATGKSMLALQLGAYLSGGGDLLGFGPRSQPGRVTIFAAEDPTPILGGRIHDLATHLSPDERDLVSECLRVIPVSSGDPRDLLDGGATTDAICREVEGQDLVVLDTLSRLHTGDENTRQDAARVMRQLERICETGPAVVFLHHTSKAAALGGQGDQQQAARGSSVWVDESRWVAFLAGCSPDEAKKYGIDEDLRRHWVRYGFSKANYCSPQPDIWLRRDVGGVLVPDQMQKVVQRSTAGKRIEKLAVVLGAEICDDPDLL